MNARNQITRAIESELDRQGRIGSIAVQPLVDAILAAMPSDAELRTRWHRGPLIQPDKVD